MQKLSNPSLAGVVSYYGIVKGYFMTIDIRWLSMPLEKYLNGGDISELEALIREVGVPACLGNQIADLLTGKLKPKTPPPLSIQMIDKALRAQREECGYKMLNKIYAMPIKAGLMKPYKPQLTDKMIKKIIADECYQGNYDTARKMVSRAKKKKESI